MKYTTNRSVSSILFWAKSKGANRVGLLIKTEEYKVNMKEDSFTIRKKRYKRNQPFYPRAYVKLKGGKNSTEVNMRIIPSIGGTFFSLLIFFGGFHDLVQGKLNGLPFTLVGLGVWALFVLLPVYSFRKQLISELELQRLD